MMMPVIAAAVVFGCFFIMMQFRSKALRAIQQSQEILGNLNVAMQKMYRQGIADERARAALPIDEREVLAYERGLREGHQAAQQVWTRKISGMRFNDACPECLVQIEKQMNAL